ncbi:MAG: 4Fe-4S binding protein [Planctomycetota bacterium]|jgi:ferredoxin
MRLNLFLPFTNDPARRGRAQRLLGALGPSWASAPIRRLVQGLCLAAFLVLLLYVSRPAGPGRMADMLAGREWIEAESFLRLDPLVAISAAVAGRVWVPALIWAGVLLTVCLILPRCFCGYVCPMGTMIDLFDWALGRRVKFLHLRRRGWWVHLRYVLLGAVMIAAAAGTLVSGYLAAIPVATRGLAFVVAPIQSALADAPRGGSWGVEHGLGVGILAAALAAGVLGPRFWCRCLCPSGAVLSVWSLLRLTDRKVTSACVRCDRCVAACSFGAVREDFSSRGADCTFCQDCGGACPARAIDFAGRWGGSSDVPAEEPSTGGRPVSRRAVLAGGLSAAAVGLGAGLLRPMKAARNVVRPPGALTEDQFLDTCVRCGECINACPTGLLGPVGISGGVQGLWTPQARTDLAACDATCNICGQVCPTGAIRALSLDRKRKVKMGLVAVDKKTCLPWQDRECGVCVTTCRTAGYEALEFRLVNVELDENDMPVEDTGQLAPIVLPDRCVGCGLCQQACREYNVQERKLLGRSAIRVFPRVPPT